MNDALLQYLLKGKDPSHLQFDDAFAQQMQQFLSAAPGGISIYSGYRSPERQAQLYEAAVRKYGSPAAARKWVAPPGRSNHGHGTAADLRYANDAAREWAHTNAEKYGLRFRMGHEPWHIEPIKGWKGTTLNSNPVMAMADGPKGQEKYLPPLPSRVVNDHPIADMPAETQTAGAFPPAPEAPGLIDRFKANAFTPDAKGATPFGGMMDVLAKAMGGNDEAMNIEPTGNLAAMEQADATRFAAAQQLLAQLMAKKRSIV